MRVLFIADVETIGGATHSLVELVKTLTRDHHECFVCTSQYGELNRKLEELSVRSIVTGHTPVMEPRSPHIWKRPVKYLYRRLEHSIMIPRALKEIEGQIDLDSIDIIHTNSARVDLGCFVSRKFSIPHIMHIREFGKEDFKCVFYKCNYPMFLNKNVDVFIAISNAVRKCWIERGIDPDRIKTIYNGIDYVDIKDSEPICKKHAMEMVIVGGVCEAKGQMIAVKAINELVKSNRCDIHLDIVGWDDPSYLSKINAYIRCSNLGSYVSVLGTDDEIHNHLKKYNIGLMCSRSEGFGRVTAEYMFAKLLVIASNSGANPEIIEDKESGLLFETDNYLDLADKMKEVYDHHLEIERMSKSGYARAISQYSIQKNVSEITSIYKWVKSM